MQRAILGLLAGAGLMAVAVTLASQAGDAPAQRAAYPPVGTGDLIAVPTPLGDKGQLLTVIDPRQQTIAVYAIEVPGGKISLRSVRNIRWDLQMTDFNGETPLPREIRLQLDQR
ncbi:MAG: hypothetical protein ABR915_17500 [Thermoguttaceae bacterium]|jgi:hypothetical protein